MTKRVFLVAAEPSGDLLGREVAEALKNQSHELDLAGIGGEEMASIGLVSPIDTQALSVLGLFEGLKAYPTVIKLANAAVDEIIAFNPQAVVLIDSWGFMLRVAQRLRKRAPNIHLIKLVGPQVWATRAGRAKTLAGTVDHLLAMFDMEARYYEPYGLKTTIIGNPALGRTKKGDGAAFRRKYNIPSAQKLMLVLPGSRPGEIKRVAPALMSAARRVHTQAPEVAIVICPAPSIAAQFAEQFPEASDFAKFSTTPEDRYDAMAASDLALACSGTVTSELAMQETPFLVGYKLGWITWAIARGFLYKPEYMTLLNISAGKEIAPEYLQTTLKPETMAKQALALLSDPEKLAAQSAAQTEAVREMGAGRRPAAVIAAEAILSDLKLAST